MKRTIIVIITTYLVVMSLVYSGFFRDTRDPIKVTMYYFEYLKNKEWFLTYQLYKPQRFSANKVFSELIDYKFQLIDKVELEKYQIQDNHAIVSAVISFKDNRILQGEIRLQKENYMWKIYSVEYKTR